MTAPAISVENIGKKYFLSRQGTGSGGLRHLVEDSIRASLRLAVRPFRKAREQGVPVPSREEEFWALRDVSFAVQPGEIVGIVGRNGAGKSTLLKILSRITEPTEGRVAIRGRVASLLEVGTGFHPELTGRENIFLNGAILGMSRGEIRSKFDEIAAFSEIGKFIDTPVKRYSSGMYVRLAFAVAAHLEPEVLIVDEVLAVGDMAFQRKCLGKLQSISSDHGRTVLFVSHNLAALEALCTRGILLEQGRVAAAGEIGPVLREYTARSVAQGDGYADLRDRKEDRFGPRDDARLLSISLGGAEGAPRSHVAMGEAVRFEIEIEFKRPGSDFEISVGILNPHNVLLHTFVSNWEGLPPVEAAGVRRIALDVPRLALFPGDYRVSVTVKQQGRGVDDSVRDALSFQSVEAQVTGHYAYFERYTQNSQTHIANHWRFLP